jgi:hypothetical protein
MRQEYVHLGDKSHVTHCTLLSYCHYQYNVPMGLETSVKQEEDVCIGRAISPALFLCVFLRYKTRDCRLLPLNGARRLPIPLRPIGYRYPVPTSTWFLYRWERFSCPYKSILPVLLGTVTLHLLSPSAGMHTVHGYLAPVALNPGRLHSTRTSKQKCLLRDAVEMEGKHDP